MVSKSLYALCVRVEFILGGGGGLINDLILGGLETLFLAGKIA